MHLVSNSKKVDRNRLYSAYGCKKEYPFYYVMSQNDYNFMYSVYKQYN